MNLEDKHEFIIKHGVLEWGIPISIIYSFIDILKEKNLYKLAFISNYFLYNILIDGIAFSIGGYIFGYFMWRRLKKSSYEENE